MALLGALEHGIYVDNEDDDECLGMSTAQIHEYFGIEYFDIEQETDGDDDEKMTTEEEEMHIPADVRHEDFIDDSEGDFGDDDSTFAGDEDWLGYISEGEVEEMQEFSEGEEGRDIVCIYHHFMRKFHQKSF